MKTYMMDMEFVAVVLVRIVAVFAQVGSHQQRLRHRVTAAERLHVQRLTAQATPERRAAFRVDVLLDAVPVLVGHVKTLDEVA